MSVAREVQPASVDNARRTTLTLEMISRTQRIFDNCAKIVDKTKRNRRFVWFIIPILVPIVTSLTSTIVTEAVLSSQLHCPNDYVAFGKNCIPKDFCPKGYISLDF